jgi:hypothetical protein
MAGLAALLSFGSDRTTNQTLRALSEALAPRGAGEALAEYGAARLLVRSALPQIREIDGTAMIIDGIAEAPNLAARYQRHGPAGLLHGEHPYALILADANGLVLGRYLDGPPLYYARLRGSVVVASEPAALLAAGVPAEPDEATVSRFLATGGCDESPATFFHGIRRVLPGQVVEVSRQNDNGGWGLRSQPVVTPRPVSARMSLLSHLPERETSRTGVLILGAGQPDIALPTAALLGSAIASTGTHRSVPVFSATFPGLTSGSFTPAVLGPLPDSAVRHKAIPFYPDEMDVDTYVTDLGEPAPGLWSYLLWAIARGNTGETDVLLSAAGWQGPSGYLIRLSDRVSARYGVSLRFPFREVDPLNVRAEVQQLAERSLPQACLRAAAQHAEQMETPVAEVLQRLRAEIVGALLYPCDGNPDYHNLFSLGTQPERLWRRYVLERWLTTVVKPRQATVPAARAGGPANLAEISAAGQNWQRRLLRTEPLSKGDRIDEKIAWYVAEFVDGVDRNARTALRKPWYLLVSAKPVAVAQGRARAIWEIEPGRLAKALSRLAGAKTRHPDPWSMQSALDEGGLIRVGSAVLCAGMGRSGWYQRISGPLVRSVSPPRELACPPANLAVVRPPSHPSKAAMDIMAALRRALPEEVFAGLRGCAIVSVDGAGARRLGWAGPDSPPPGLIKRLCEGNPFGQGDERTPLLVALPGNAPAQGRKPAKRRSKSR